MTYAIRVVLPTHLPIHSQFRNGASVHISPMTSMTEPSFGTCRCRSHALHVGVTHQYVVIIALGTLFLLVLPLRPAPCIVVVYYHIDIMAAALGQTVFRKVLKGKAADYEPQDPYYIYEERPGKAPKKKVKPLPQGLSLHDQKILKKVRRRAHLLDRSVNCCCCCNCQFGLAAILGMVPIVGDITSFVLGYKLVTSTAQGIEGGLPESVRAQMVAINMAALGIGFVPFVGDIINATIKPNSRNAALFEAWLIRTRAHGGGGGGGGQDKPNVAGVGAGATSTGTQSSTQPASTYDNQAGAPSVQYHTNTNTNTKPTSSTAMSNGKYRKAVEL